jgi:SAM-dependent methyltransferase
LSAIATASTGWLTESGLQEPSGLFHECEWVNANRVCCGTGGLPLAIARAKADDRGIEVEFAAVDAFQLERLGRRFATVLDCGLFHTFDGDERPGYVASLASVTEHDGTLYVLCFSDDGPDPGPHPVSQQELRAAFNPSTGWKVAAIEPDRVQTSYHDNGAPAWLATIKRIQTAGLL